ncbi:MAG: acetyl-CoA carboxylase biotin carboxyl carrier protein subunit [Anaerolineaceae bacterium]|nr:acetyl-CoA carboxylase biotin carboxyl carrier protein subunit [Anaerolineaceae bacterium]
MDTVNYHVNENVVEIRQLDQALEVNGKIIQVQLLPNSNGKVKLLLGEEVLAFDVLEKGHECMVLAKDGLEYHVSKDEIPETAEEIVAESSTQSDLIQVKAPLPGVVVKLSVAIGDLIKKDDVVLIVESMKMQIDVRSSAGGEVRNILVKPGDQVEVDMAVVEIA